MIRAGIVGGAGYTGGELIRLLVNHIEVEIAFVQSSSQAGKSLTTVHADLAGDIDLHFSNEISEDIDVLFLCVGHGDARKFLEANSIASHIKIIDLSQDFRIAANATLQNRQFVYGLPELNKEQINTAHNIANPGCFATCIQLGLLPLSKAGHLINNVHTTGITGSTGAGQGLSPTSHFSWRSNNIQAYKTLTHQHLAEIYQSLNQLQITVSNNDSNENTSSFIKSETAAQIKPQIVFVPWRGDFTRGIYVSSVIETHLSQEEAYSLYKDFYATHPFTIVSKTAIDMKQVINTNKCLLHLEKVEDQLVIHSTIDNLLKGASGQAVQNMNLMFGINETAGLKLKSIGF
jgi:N-acetyl-gamma-glutamyl-phosphate reductase